MIDDLAGIDVGADFEAWAPGLQPVTVTSINAVTGAIIATKADVPAARLLRKGTTGPARSGEVWNAENEWWLRVDRLGFALKPRDRITEAGGAVWVIGDVTEVAGALVRCPVTRMRA